LHLAQLGRHLALEGLGQRDDLQLRLGDLPLDAGDLGDVLALLALETGRLALK
jgi:hypothetical protein